MQTDSGIQWFKLISLLVFPDPNSVAQVMLISDINAPYAITVNLIIMRFFFFLTKMSI